MSQTYPCKECRETFSKACSFRNQQKTHSWVSLGIFLLWSVNHSFHKRNENDFFTWVFLDIFLLWTVNNSFHKRNENDFSSWVSLDIFLLWSISHSFHKRNENDFSTWFSLGNWNWKKIITISIFTNIQICFGIFFLEKWLTYVAKVGLINILYENDH